MFGKQQENLLRKAHSDFEANDGFAIVDNFFEENIAERFLKEIQDLKENDFLRPNAVQFSLFGEKVVVEKPGIFELDLFDPRIKGLKILEHFETLYETHCTELIRILEKLGYHRDLKLGKDGRVVKLQWNNGKGGCFPFHYDNPGRPNNRILTCAFYLNKAWTQGDGGELILVPFLKAPVVIPPVFNRLVIFRSDLLLHSVTPSKVERFCFTIWVDGSSVNTDEDIQIKLNQSDYEDAKNLATKLRKTPAQRMLARSTYRESFEASIKNCFGDSEAFDMLVRQHKTHIEALNRSESVASLVETLREIAEVLHI